MIINYELVLGESPSILNTKVAAAITGGKAPSSSPYAIQGPHGPLFFQEVAEGTGHTLTAYELISAESTTILASKLDAWEDDNVDNQAFGSAFSFMGPHGPVYYQAAVTGTVASGGGGGTNIYQQSTALLTSTNVWTKNNSVTIATLTSTSGVIATDVSLSNNFFVELTEATAELSNPTNLTGGMVLNWVLKQGTGGSKLLTFGNKFKFFGGTNTVSTSAGAYDMITGLYISSEDIIICNLAIGAV